MSSLERPEPKRSENELKNDPPARPNSLCRSKCRSRPRLLACLKPCCMPPVGLPRGVHDERQRRRDAMLLEPRPAAGPIAYRVPLGEDELEGRIAQSPLTARNTPHLQPP